MATKLADKNILLIGGTSGIGFAVAQQVLADGANITISSSSDERVNKALESLRTANPARASAVRTYVADLSIKENLDTTVENLLRFAAESSPIDHIVFTAGNIPPLVPLSESSFDDVDALMTVRFYGAVALGKHAAKYVASKKSSTITLTTGTQTKKPMMWLPPAVGGAIEGLMRGLAVTLAPVRVNVVAPGFIDTGIVEKFPKEISSGALEKYTQNLLTKDVGYAENTAEAYLYLMKDNFVTGSVLETNGGAHLI